MINDIGRPIMFGILLEARFIILLFLFPFLFLFVKRSTLLKAQTCSIGI